MRGDYFAGPLSDAPTASGLAFLRKRKGGMSLPLGGELERGQRPVFLNFRSFPNRHGTQMKEHMWEGARR